MLSHKCHWAVHRSDAVMYQCEVEYNATGGAAKMRHLKSHRKKTNFKQTDKSKFCRM